MTTQQLKGEIQSLIVYYDVVYSAVRGKRRLKAANKLVEDFMKLISKQEADLLEEIKNKRLPGTGDAICISLTEWSKLKGDTNET